jgi:aminoglycoside 6'-N-acetyltransferase I
MNKVTIREVAVEDKPEWLQMRLALWEHLSPQVQDTEMEEIFSDPMGAVFVAVLESGGLCGFLEVGTRDYAEGCQTSPVGYIEAWYVDVDMRGQGIGEELVRRAETWAREQGHTEMASDTFLDNQGSIRAHLKLGYQEAERLIHFSKKLDDSTQID